MITEHRRITFSRNSVLDALAHSVSASQVTLTPGHVVGLRIVADGSCAIKIERLGGASRSEVELKPAQMAAILLSYAKHLAIPIPKRGTKQLEGSRDELTLVVTLGHTPE
jgi:hypothetical protein